MKNKKVNIEISRELFERLEKERDEFIKSINMDFNIEMTIWEMFKILNTMEKK